MGAGMIAAVLESDLSEEQREQLQLARYSGLLLHGILNDVLDISKIDAGKAVLEGCDFDLSGSTKRRCLSHDAPGPPKGTRP